MTKQHELRFNSGEERIFVVLAIVTYMEHRLGYREGVAE